MFLKEKHCTWQTDQGDNRTTSCQSELYATHTLYTLHAASRAKTKPACNPRQSTYGQQVVVALVYRQHQRDTQARAREQGADESASTTRTIQLSPQQLQQHVQPSHHHLSKRLFKGICPVLFLPISVSLSSSSLSLSLSHGHRFPFNLKKEIFLGISIVFDLSLASYTSPAIQAAWSLVEHTTSS